MLQTSYRVDGFVVVEHVLVRVVVLVFATNQQPCDSGHFVGHRLGGFPKRLMRTAARSVFVVEDFATGRELPFVQVVYKVLSDTRPRRTVPIDHMTRLASIQQLGGKSGRSEEHTS